MTDPPPASMYRQGELFEVEAATNIAVRLARADEPVIRVLEGLRAAADVHDPMVLGELRGMRSRLKLLSPLQGDAERAVALLGELPQSAPIRRLRETLEAVGDVRAFGRLPRHEISSAATRLDDDRLAAELWTRIAHLDDTARAAELERMRGLGIERMQPDDWARLSAIIDADDTGRLAPGLPRQLSGGALSLSALARNIASGGPASHTLASPFTVTRRYLDAWQASIIDRAERVRVVERILGANPSEVAREDWKLLASILDTDPSVASIGAAGAGDLADQARRVGTFAHAPLDDVTRWHHLRRLQDSAELRDATRATLLDPRAEVTTPEARALLELDQLDVVGIGGADAAAARLRHHIPTNPRDATAWLADVATWLREGRAPVELEGIQDTALSLVERNQARIAGTLTDGFRGHPDYAELGRIHSLFRLVDIATLPPTATPPPAVPRVARPGDLDEVLPW